MSQSARLAPSVVSLEFAIYDFVCIPLRLVFASSCIPACMQNQFCKLALSMQVGPAQRLHSTAECVLRISLCSIMLRYYRFFTNLFCIKYSELQPF